MPDERLITEIENILNTVVELGAEKERTRMVPNLLVTDASPTGLSNFIIVKDDRDGDNILATKVPGIIYNTNDLVNVLFIRGGEAIAFQQGSGSSSSGLWEIVLGSSTDIYYNAGDVVIGKTSEPDAALEIVDSGQAQLRLTHTDATKFADFTLDTNHDLTITPSSIGQVILQPTTDSTDFFQVLDADGGTPILNVDSVNEYVGIGTIPTNKLTIQGNTASNVTAEIFAGDGDGTDNVNLLLYGVGTPGSVVNRERLLIQYLSASNEWRMQSEADGTGTLRPLILETEGNDDQIYLGTTGAVGINTADVSYTSEAATTTPELIVLREDTGGKRGAVYSIISDSGNRTAQNSFLKAKVGPAAVASGVRIGDFFWEGHDGTDYNRSARFGTVVDGAVSANTVPMALTFDTSANNSAGLTERMRITSAGLVGLNGVTSPSTELDIGAGSIEFDEMTAPGGGAANTARLYAVDNGAGKTQLVVIFNTGAAQVLATEP